MELKRHCLRADFREHGLVCLSDLFLLRGRLVKSLAFSVVFFFVSLAVLCLSLLYMLAPRTYRRFVALYSRADTWSSINPIPPKERFISERVAGFFMTLMELMMVRV